MLVALVLVPLSFVVYLAIVACVAVMKGWPVTDSVCVAAIVIPAMSYISMRVVGMYSYTKQTATTGAHKRDDQM